jgi:tetratricopeptide (TPR) repeat protein
MPKRIGGGTAAPTRATIFAVCAGLALITWLVFGQVLGHQFVNYDDEFYIYENARVMSGLSWQNVWWAVTHTVCFNWHPLTVISHMFDCQLYGLRPAGHHFTSVLFHSVAVILLFLALRQMTHALWKSAFVAAVFAVHPLHVESVAWVSERKDTLSAVLFVLTLGAYTHYVRRRSLTAYFLVLLLFALGLMAKPMLVTLPFLLLLLDWWPLRRLSASPKSNDRSKILSGSTIGCILLEKIPLFFLSAASCFATLVAQKSVIYRFDQLSLTERAGNAALAITIYLRQSVLPMGLSVFYPHPRHELSAIQVGAAFLLLGVITVAAFIFRRAHPYCLVGWCWFIGMLIPVIGIVQVGGQSHADRYTYLPQIGLVMAVTWLVENISLAMRNRTAILGAAAGVIVASLMGLGWKQTMVWRDSRSLWMHALAVNPRNDTAHNALAAVALRENQVDEAIFHARNALEIRPDSPDAHNQLGQAFLSKGRRAEARAEFQRVIAISPNRPRVHYNLGTLLLEAGELDDAIVQFREEIKIQPAFVEAYTNLGTALVRKGELDQALAYFQKAVEMDPYLPKVHYNIALILRGRGQRDEAAFHLQKELQVNPANAEAHSDLGVVWLEEGRVKEAIDEWQKTLELDPANLNAQVNLAWTLATFPDSTIRNGAKAVDLAERALQVSGERDPRIYQVMAAAYAEHSQFDAAVGAAERGAEVARRQGDNVIADALQSNAELYRRRLPLRTGLR